MKDTDARRGRAGSAEEQGLVEALSQAAVRANLLASAKDEERALELEVGLACDLDRARRCALGAGVRLDEDALAVIAALGREDG